MLWRPRRQTCETNISKRQMRMSETEHDLPADSSTGCSSNNSSLHTPEETLCTISSRNNTSSLEQTLGTSNLGIGRATSGLQQSLDDIERGSGSSGDTTSKTSSGTVSQRVVAVAAVHEFCNGFVSCELEGGKGDGHGEGGGVRDVKGAEALVAEDGACALGEGCVDTSVYLHALLDDCESR
jgi:hypothetical protein